MSAADSSPQRQTSRIDEIETQWSLLRLAHRDSVTSAGPARDHLVLRYNRAIRGYIGALVRDEHAADELAQDVVVRLLRGDFAGATPQRGRFRDLLKVAVKNMVRNYWSRQQGRAARNVQLEQLADFAVGDPPDDDWLAQWQATVLGMAWRALEAYQRETPGSLAHTVLKLRADHPDDDMAALALRLRDRAAQTMRPDALRQQLRRARLRFAQLLVEEIARSLDDPSPQRVEEELVNLELLDHVRDFLPPDWHTRGQLRLDAGQP